MRPATNFNIQNPKAKSIKISNTPRRNIILLLLLPFFWWPFITAGLFLTAFSIAAALHPYSLPKPGTPPHIEWLAPFLATALLPICGGGLILSFYLTLTGRLSGARLPNRRNAILLGIMFLIWWTIFQISLVIAGTLICGIVAYYQHPDDLKAMGPEIVQFLLGNFRPACAITAATLSLWMTMNGDLPGTRK